MGESSELAITTTMVVQPATGEVFDLDVPEQAARAVQELKALEEQLKDYRRDAELALVRESQRQGTRTLRMDGAEVRISGGPSTEIDPQELERQLRQAGCPEERIRQAVVEEISYSVKWSVCQQLSAANPEYKKAVDAARRPIEKRYGVSVKT